MKKLDDLYSAPLEQIVDFSFDDQVVAVFPDMIQRSVPGYALMISTLGVLAGQYAQAGTSCYDLGCSLGASSLSMQQHIREPGCRIVAVDNSQAMVNCARDFFADREPAAVVPVKVICDDVRSTSIDNASVVVLNLTLQFIEPAQRLPLLEKIYKGLRPGGALILSEKVAFAEPDRQSFQTSLHENFKRAQGYSDLEVSQKRTALEKVLLPETLACHQERLKAAGFGFIDVWFQCLNFISLVALK